MTLHPIRAAYQRGLTTGRQQATRAAVDHLRAHADTLRNIRDGREPGVRNG